jgi:hypothetical protein
MKQDKYRTQEEEGKEDKQVKMERRENNRNGGKNVN